MKRVEFLRKSLLAIAAVAVVPSVVLSRPTVRVPKVFGPSSQVFCFKISKEVLEDKENFTEVLKEMKVYRKIQEGQLVSIEMGYQGDDFIEGCMTVLLKLK